MRYTIMLLCVLASAPVRADLIPSWCDSWCVADNALMLTDWLQTYDIANNPDKFTEVGLLANLYGSHPSTGEVTRGYAAIWLSTNLIGWVLPENAHLFGLEFNPRKVFYIANTALDAHQVYNNYQIGIHISLP